MLCLGNHPATECPQRDSKDTQGKANWHESDEVDMLQTSSVSDKAISVLYPFAGKPRPGDMTQCLQQRSLGYNLRVTCVDIQRKPSVDLAKTKERQKLLARIRAQEFHATLISPPCSTFSRAPWANFKGPRPVQSAAKPRGLDNSSGTR